MNFNIPDAMSSSLLVLLPEWIVSLVAVTMMVLGAFTTGPRWVWSSVTAGALVLALLALQLIRGVEPDPYATVALNDAMSYWGRVIIYGSGLILIGLAYDQVADQRLPEFMGALLLLLAGSAMVSTANELVFLFVGLELVSIPTYLLMYLARRESQSQEAITKYFFLSVLSSALFVFGLAYLYGITGISNFKGMAYVLKYNFDLISPATTALGMIGIVFVTAGLGFRVAAVPFHFYAPDVYQGSPTVIAATLAWIPKAVGFFALIRVLSAVFSVGSGNPSPGDLSMLLAWVIALATMVLGNSLALIQTNIKRLFAYSSIAHAGYLMIGLAAAFCHVTDPNQIGEFPGNGAIIFYLVAYALMTLGAFGVLLLLDRRIGKRVESIDDLAGLVRQRPLVTLAMTFCLFSLAGVPPFAGFWGKFFVFASAWDAPLIEGMPSLKLLAVLGALNAAVGGYYYLRIIVVMYFGAPAEATETPVPLNAPWPSRLAVGACAVLSLFFGCYLKPLRDASQSAAAESTALPPVFLEQTEEAALVPSTNDEVAQVIR